MSNVSWMYKNLCQDPLSITDTIGTSNSLFGTNRLADGDLQSYWTSNSLGTVVSILLDMGSAVWADTFIVVHNLPVVNNEPSAGTFTLYLNAGNTNPPITSTYYLSNPASLGTSMYYGSAVNYRYFRLLSYGTSFNEQTKINEIFIGKRDTFSVNPEYPFKRETDSSTIVTISEKGQKKVYHKYTRTNWELSYPSIDEITYGTMLKIRKYCSGSYKPFFVCFDIDDNKFETFMVRFGKNGFKNKEINYNIHDVSIRLEEEL